MVTAVAIGEEGQYAAPVAEKWMQDRVSGGLGRWTVALGRAVAPRAYTAIVLGALSCNLGAKLFHAGRYGLLREYPGWIGTDIAVLVTVETALAVIAHCRPTKEVIRGVLIFAAVVCAWSVMNAGWLIRTGTQILPMELWPLIRDPLGISWIIIINLVRMPGAAAVLVIPSAVALAWFFPVLAKAVPPAYNVRRFRVRVIASLAVALAALGGDAAVSSLELTPVTAGGLRFNCQLRAVLAFVLPAYRQVGRSDFINATRQLPRSGEIRAKGPPGRKNHNVVIVVLEGIQYDCTSVAREQGGVAPQTGGLAGGPTPFLSTVAAEGVSFTSARAVVTHTTKALFALLTGRFPSASQDISETVPVDPPYAGLATILRRSLGFRTAFFQSAKGTFEARPGLVHNLGFEKFWAREDLDDLNQFVGYLGCDEFAMLGPMTQWIQSEDKPFLLVVLCSVTHDPYQVPSWFGEEIRDQAERYLQTVCYTDRFLAALDTELTNLHLAGDTILCVVGDHGEGFGEHQIMGHERLAFEEVLRVALCVRAPLLVEPGTRIAAPVSSVDLTPTILGLLGFDVAPMGFDGADALRALPKDRKVYFSGWMHQGPAGFVQADRKYIYNPDRGAVRLYCLKTDPLELAGTELPEAEAEKISDEIMAWRKGTIFRPETGHDGNRELFGSWLWKDNGRVSRIKNAAGG